MQSCHTIMNYYKYNKSTRNLVNQYQAVVSQILLATSEIQYKSLYKLCQYPSQLH